MGYSNDYRDMVERERRQAILRTLDLPALIAGAEGLVKAKVVTFTSQFDPDLGEQPGGMCSCCGCSPRIESETDWIMNFRAGLCDEDGEYYAQLCETSDGGGCLGAIRAENAHRKPTGRDLKAAILTELLGDDTDGAEAMMEDLADLPDADDL
jgi:hypothetical protein